MNDVEKIIKSLPEEEGDCEVIRFIRWLLDRANDPPPVDTPTETE